MLRLFIAIIFFFPFISNASNVEEELASFVRSYCGSKDVEVRILNLPSFKKGEDMRIKDIYFSRIPDERGNGVLSLYIQDGKRTKKTFVAFRLLKKEKILIAKRELKKGDQLRPEDIEIREVILEGGERYPLSLEEVLGKRLRKDVKPESVITRGMIESPILVERGGLVELIFEDEKLLVRTKGKALERGRTGDIIRVKNLISGKEISGRVIGENRVSVN